MTTIILRRPKLGMGGVKAVCDLSEAGIVWIRNDNKRGHISLRERNRRGRWYYPWPNEVDLVIRWGCTSETPVPAIVNSNRAIQTVNNKAEFRMALQSVDPSLVPTTWMNKEDVQYPAIVRPLVHSRGRHCVKVDNLLELSAVIRQPAFANGWYASKYIQKVAEYRIMFVSGRVCWVARKTPGDANAIAWNVACGGRFDNVRFNDWPLRAIRVAKVAFDSSNLDFGGVDIMVDSEGSCYVLEINSAPSQTSPYRQSCTAKCLDYIVNNGKEVIPVIEARGNYRKFIHPAISSEAILV